MKTDQKNKSSGRFQIFLNARALKEWLSPSLALEKPTIENNNEKLSLSEQPKDIPTLAR